VTIFNDRFSIVAPINLGIVGGGQLGKMLAMEAKRMNMKVVILDPNLECPASSIADKVIVGSFSDAEKIYELSRDVDIITYEIELANSTALENLEKKNFSIYPSPNILKIIQNKYRQKKFLLENGINVPKFDLIVSESQLEKLCMGYGFPIMLKACEDSYDGRGNFLINNKDQIKTAFSHFGNRQCMIEEYIPFKKELSIMIAKNPSGDISAFPVAENIHKDNILYLTMVPAQITKDIEVKANSLAIKTIQALNGVGIFGIEMFVDTNDNVLVNEIAPRPHNSGHYSIESCSISQFEQHIRAILNYPIPKPKLISSAVMVNLLGPKNEEGIYEVTGVDKLFSIDGVKLHIYGKKNTQYHRKLGHVTVLLNDGENPLRVAEEIAKIVNISEIK